MGDGFFGLAHKLKLCGFCIIEIILDTALFFILVVITASLHNRLNDALVYFHMDKDYAVQLLVSVGTIFLIVCGFIIVALFAIKSVKEAYAQTIKNK